MFAGLVVSSFDAPGLPDMKTSPIRSASGRKSAWTRKQQAAPPSNSNFSAPVPQPGGASVDLLDDDLTDGEADFDAFENANVAAANADVVAQMLARAKTQWGAS